MKEIGRTKAQVPRAINNYPIAEMPCYAIKSNEIFEFLQSVTGQPQTVGNYASCIAAVFAVARPMWDYRLCAGEMSDAIIVARRMGIISRSAQRDRRPARGELDSSWRTSLNVGKAPQALPMHKVILFALFSTRCLAEITRIAWNDFQKDHKRVLVPTKKSPGEKIGNETWGDLPEKAIQVIESMRTTNLEIFPCSPDAITANFTRACRLLGIEDLHFHDLRHEGISRPFEMGRNIPQVAVVSGHRSWVSLKRYTHMRERGDKYLH